MNILKENIINVYGTHGENWLESLPRHINYLAEHWSLNNLVPVKNMTFNYVATAVQNDNHVVLKISCDKESIFKEASALSHFAGNASIKLIDINEEYNAILLQQAIPGKTLKNLYPNNVELVIENYASTAKQLHYQDLPSTNNYKNISNWLEAIDKSKSGKIPNNLLEHTIVLKNKLLASSAEQVLLHGDLHLDNILQHGDDWLAIDPKGVIGEPAFDIAKFDFIAENEIKLDVTDLFAQRVKLCANKNNIDEQRLKEWIFVRLILSAAWFIEDNSDPRKPIALANSLMLIL